MNCVFFGICKKTKPLKCFSNVSSLIKRTSILYQRSVTHQHHYVA